MQAPADVQGMVRTLRALYEKCATAAQGIPGKKREMDDTGKYAPLLQSCIQNRISRQVHLTKVCTRLAVKLTSTFKRAGRTRMSSLPD